jgi:hypothetical protein
VALALSFRQPGPPDDRSDAASMGLPVPGRRAALRGTRRTGGPRGSGSSDRTGTRSSSGTRASPSSRLHPSPSAGPAVHEPFARRSRVPPASPGYGRNFRSRCVFIVFPVPSARVLLRTLLQHRRLSAVAGRVGSRPTRKHPLPVPAGWPRSCCPRATELVSGQGRCPGDGA